MKFPAARCLPWGTGRQEPDDRPSILLVGAGGQIGAELWQSLQPLGNVVRTVRAVDSTADTEAVLDLQRPAAIRGVLERVRPDLVVNAAAYTDVERAEREPDLAMLVNGIAAGTLAEEARRLGAGLIHFSTDYVFDGEGVEPWHEKDGTHPLNAYGRSKLMGEDAIRGSGVDHLIVRTSWVYGRQGKNFVQSMLRLGNEQPQLRVVDDQVGAPTSARLVADTTAQILSQARGRFAAFLTRYGGPVHLCCRGETSWHGFAEEIFRRARQRGVQLAVRAVEPITSSQYGSPVVRPANSRLDCRRLQQRFGLTLPDWQSALALSLEEMLLSRDAQPLRPPRDGEPVGAKP